MDQSGVLPSHPQERALKLLRPDAHVVVRDDGLIEAPIGKVTPGLQANAAFFSHPRWGAKYFEVENHRALIGPRWMAATGSWDGKVVVDLGCGPGNLFRAVDGTPALLIGVDVSAGALAQAAKLGYVAMLADAHCTPLMDACADLVVANATLHHTDDPAAVLAEAARLLKPGGLLVTDEDPLRFNAKFSMLGNFIRWARGLVPVARVRHHPNRRFVFASPVERKKRHLTEIHQKFVGDGLDRAMFDRVLTPRGFTFRLLPHGHVAGAEILQGGRGRNTALLQISQRVSDIDPEQSDALMSVMCIARKPLEADLHEPAVLRGPGR
jgi:SAM-dependent methyltransferase